jgi:hypothetical protein
MIPLAYLVSGIATTHAAIDTYKKADTPGKVIDLGVPWGRKTRMIAVIASQAIRPGRSETSPWAAARLARDPPPVSTASK